MCTVERTSGVKPTRRKPDGHVLNQAAEAMTWSGQYKVCCLLQIVSVSMLRPYASDVAMMMMMTTTDDDDDDDVNSTRFTVSIPGL